MANPINDRLGIAAGTLATRTTERGAPLPRVALIVVEPTATAVAEKLAVVDPAGTVTEDGKVKIPVGKALRATTLPPVGAGKFRVTVTWTSAPTGTGTEGALMLTSVSSCTETLDVAAPPPSGAGRMALTTVEPTATPVTRKVALVAFAGMDTVAGTVAAAGVDETRLTVTAEGCAWLIVTVS